MTQYTNNNNNSSNSSISLIQTSTTLNDSTPNKLNSILFKPTINKKIVNKPSLLNMELKPQQQIDSKKSSIHNEGETNEEDNQRRKKLKYSSEDSNQEDYDEEYELSRQNDDKLNVSPSSSSSKKTEIKKEEEKPDKKLKLHNAVSMKKKRKKLIMKKFKHNKSLTDILLNLSDTIFDIFNSLITIEHDYNGGAKIITCKYDDLVQKLGSNRQLMKQFANYFLNLCYFENEKTKRAEYSLGVINNGAINIPDILEYFSEHYPSMNVKSSMLTNNKEIQTLKMIEYKEKVFESYYNGTYRYGPLLQTSIVGVKNEEIGGYFPEFIEKYLNDNVFLRLVLPWGKFSIRSNTSPKESNDGPIIWSRPGEQMLPTTIVRELEKKADRKKK